MIEVKLFIKSTSGLYVSNKVYKFIKSYETGNEDGNIDNEALKKLQKLAERNFERDGVNIRHEGHGVFRISLPRNGRIIGFHDEYDFIAINCFKKPRQKLNKGQQKIIKDVKRIRKNKLWKRSIK